jgi:hypothetical protein
MASLSLTLRMAEGANAASFAFNPTDQVCQEEERLERD